MLFDVIVAIPLFLAFFIGLLPLVAAASVAVPPLLLVTAAAFAVLIDLFVSLRSDHVICVKINEF